MSNIYNKYIKYKFKYLSIKKQFAGSSSRASSSNIVGINYEGGKIISHILKSENCIAYANCQIAMDAPYHGRVADESIRSKGRSELQFPGYTDEYLISKFEEIFNYIKINYPNIKIVIQIARGRSAISMKNEIIDPILLKLKIKETDYEFKSGYRSTDYYTPRDTKEFVFVNIGMFAVLTNVENTKVGQICNPTETVIATELISELTPDKKILSDYSITSFDNKKNILSNMTFQKIKLIGIADNMPFVTPDVYPNSSINELIAHL